MPSLLPGFFAGSFWHACLPFLSTTIFQDRLQDDSKVFLRGLRVLCVYGFYGAGTKYTQKLCHHGSDSCRVNLPCGYNFCKTSRVAISSKSAARGLALKMNNFGVGNCNVSANSSRWHGKVAVRDACPQSRQARVYPLLVRNDPDAFRMSKLADDRTHLGCPPDDALDIAHQIDGRRERNFAKRTRQTGCRRLPH